jgi:molybdopterin synthase catalytic subunit
MLVDIRSEALSVDEAVAHVSRGGAGAVCVFLGTVRDHSEGHAVERLEYHAYASMARTELERIAREVESMAEGVRVAALHRMGSLGVGEIAVVCSASAPHRAEAFEAARALIEAIKVRVPIWKREQGPDGTSWIGWVDARCASHEHGAPGQDGRAPAELLRGGATRPRQEE